MNFNSVQFVGFLAVALVLFWSTRGATRRSVLLLTSYVFYGLWDWRFLALLIVMSGFTYAVGLGLRPPVTDNEPSSSARRSGRLLLVGIVGNLAVLALFKYFNFFTDSLFELLRGVGFSGDSPALRLFLPIGISFYVFESISYLVDIHGGKVEPERDPVKVGLFLSYFPKALAGPIERPRHLLPQLECGATGLRADDVRSGALLILLGLFQKVVLADLSAPYVNDVFAETGKMSAPALLAATYAFAIQIYGDFAGYTNMARGISRLFGIDLIRNFHQPYLASNPVDFWKRWHISLSTWLRDYLYIPLGGNRAGRWAEYRNLMITMLLGGLWHGASWNFVIWGGLHGTYLVGHRLLVTRAGAAPRSAEAPSFASWKHVALTFGFFHLVCVTWVFFRVPQLDQALTILRRIGTFAGGETPVRILIVPLLLAATLAMEVVLERRPTTASFRSLRPQFQGALCAAAAVAILLASGGQGAPFIYFAF